MTEIDKFNSVDVLRQKQLKSEYFTMIKQLNNKSDNSIQEFDMTNFVTTIVQFGDRINLSNFEDFKQSDPKLYRTIAYIIM